MEIQERYERAMLTQELYPNFVPFCEEVMHWLGFRMTWMQKDIAEYMEDLVYHRKEDGMVQAQRGEAKSTIAVILGVYDLIHNPRHRVALVSGVKKKADENGMLAHGIVHRFEPVSYLIPDAAAKQRTGTAEFDVHYSLKGVDKSPSISCFSVSAGNQGLRSDLLIPDDIETLKNGLTATGRETLITQSKEFRAICASEESRILYLGTPQTKDSIYVSLPSRGYDVRIWPGRFPSHEQEVKYGDFLAPSIRERLAILGDECRTGYGLDGSLGMQTDPDRYTEKEMLDKELDYGPEGYCLQYMLDTSLADAARMQLKLKDFIVGDFHHERVPEQVEWAPNPGLAVDMSNHQTMQGAELYYTAATSTVFAPLEQMTMVIDPAGDGGDELSFTIGGVLGPYLHICGLGGLKGGFADDNLEKLAELVKEFGVERVLVESNMGAGAVGKLIRNYFIAIDPKTNKPRVDGVGVEDIPSGNQQKERRIIDTIRPVLQRHRIVLHKRAIEMDNDYLNEHNRDKRAKFSALYQLENITYDRDCLEKDDRADAVEQLVRALADNLVKDENKEADARDAKRVKDFIKNPMGHFTQHSKKPKRARSRAAMKRFSRR